MARLPLDVSSFRTRRSSDLWAKSPLLVPVMLMLAIVSAELPLLVRVAGGHDLAVVTGWQPKEAVAREKMTPGAVAVPLKLAVCGLRAAVSATLTVPLRVPAA